MRSALEIVSLEPDQFAAGEMLARAFMEDPLTRYCLPEESHRRRALPSMVALLRRGYLFGEAYATRGEVHGVAVWIPPDSGEAQEKRLPQADFGEMAAAFGEEAMGRFVAVLDTLEGYHLRDPHWYLLGLGVEPARQRQGIGSRLVRFITERADREGLPCYLETLRPENVLFYRTLGFEVQVEGEFPGGPHFWTMKRGPLRGFESSDFATCR
jgi:ribosomal protein S18 acetylase RimI-like enzyme